MEDRTDLSIVLSYLCRLNTEGNMAMSDMVDELIVSIAKLEDDAEEVCSKLLIVLDTTSSAEETLAKMHQIMDAIEKT